MLTLARRSLRQVLRALQKDIHDGVPVIGLEPKLRVGVQGRDAGHLAAIITDARRLSKQTFVLSDSLKTTATCLLL